MDPVRLHHLATPPLSQLETSDSGHAIAARIEGNHSKLSPTAGFNLREHLLYVASRALEGRKLRQGIARVRPLWIS